MSWSDKISVHARRFWTVVFAAVFFALPYLILSSGTPVTFHSWLLDIFRSVKGTPPPAEPQSEFFQWEELPSEFRPLNFDHAAQRPIDELCQGFPSEMLQRVQPVLKTGHGVIETRVAVHLNSTSACLDNLLIFSDFEETFQGHQIHDVLADIPSDWSHIRKGVAREKDQFESYYRLQELAANSSLESTIDLREGWKLDKFKFLAGISTAWRRSANKEWYVFYEDDTYIVWDNLFRMLGHFNPDTAWYFGSPTPDRIPYDSWPDTWLYDNSRTSFAYGGTGYILSRAAMRRLVHDEWNWETGEYLGMKLSERWWDEEVLANCCGDSILGWAAFNAGIKLSGIWPMFSQIPPRRIGFNNAFWCKPFLATHKARAEHMLGMWRWEWEHRKADRPLLYRDLATTYFDFENITSKADWDNMGRSTYNAPAPSDQTRYSHDPHASFTECERACEASPECKQYSYHLRMCKFDKAFRWGAPREAEAEKKPKNKDEPWTEEDKRFQAGWMRERILQWMEERSCEKTEWVRLSTKRIF